MNKLFSVIIVIFNVISLCRTRYVLPEVLIEPLSPKGLRVSMPVTQGGNIQLFGFHANINRAIRGKEEGDISRSSTRPVNGRWVVSDDGVQLKVGDKLHYWLFAQSNRLGFDKEDQTFVITELKDASATDKCPLSLSTIDNIESLCTNAVIFEDNFRRFDDSIWEVLQFTPQYALPGREFVSYENKNENLFISDDFTLNIKPTIRTEDEVLNQIPYDLSIGCSIDDNPGACAIKGTNSYEILPPIKSARIRSKHAFKYGRIEVEAKLPLGDWLVPHILLEPRDHVYGNRSGEMYIAYNRGNVNLRDDTGDIGQNSLYCGLAFTDERTEHMKKMRDPVKWGESYHTYSLEWRPEGIICMIDNRKVSEFPVPKEGFKSLVRDSSLISKSWISPSAPFDQYFYLTIGLSVGGIIDFPSNVQKPWDNSDPRAPMKFFDSQAEWGKTWSSDSTLRIKKVRVYAI